MMPSDTCGDSIQLQSESPSVPSTSPAVKFKCPACGRCYQGIERLCAHLIEDHYVTATLQCKVCSASFNKCEELTLHLTQHQSKSTNHQHQQQEGETCSDTGSRAVSPAEFSSNHPSPLATYFTEDHEDVLVEPAVSSSFSVDTDGADPLAVSTELHIENECKCGMVLSNPKQLEYHKNSHSLRVCVRPKCPKCSVDFSGVEKYFNHQCNPSRVNSNTRGETEHIRICFECNKKFVIASDILLHQRKFGLGSHQLFDFIVHNREELGQSTKITPVAPLPTNIKFSYPKVRLQKLVSGASNVIGKRRTRRAHRGPVPSTCRANSGGNNDPVGSIRLVDPRKILEAGGVLSSDGHDYTDHFEPDVISVCSGDSGDVVVLEDTGGPSQTSSEAKRLKLATGLNSLHPLGTITGNLIMEPSLQVFGINEGNRRLRKILPKPAQGLPISRSIVGTTRCGVVVPPRVVALQTFSVMPKKPGLRKLLPKTSILHSIGGTASVGGTSVTVPGSKKKKRKEPLYPRTDVGDGAPLSTMSTSSSRILETTKIPKVVKSPKKKKRKQALNPRAIDRIEDPVIAENNTQRLATEIKRKYVRRQQKRKDMNCDHCGQEFQILEELLSHMADHKKRLDSYECEFCGVVYIHRTRLAQHKMEHPENTQIYCRHCGLPYATEEKLKNHMEASHATLDKTRYYRSEKRLCDICGKNVKHLDAHRKLHEGKIHKCDECDKAFSSKAMLRFHKNAHLAVPPYKCGFCPWRYADQNQIKFHMIRRHLGPEGFIEVDVDGLEKNFICDQCGRAYTTAFALKEHQMFHEEPKVPCPRCPQLFHTKYEKYSHYWKNHVGPSKLLKKNYKCNLCDKSYKVLSDLKYHQATHTGEFKFRCEVCGKGTHSRGNMNAHMKKHGGGYCCPTCNNRFITFPLLREHVSNEHGQVIDLYDWKRSGGMGTYAK